MAVNENPCTTCSIDQGCCTSLSGLKLARKEFEEHFSRHREALTVLNYDETYIISANQGHACPHWGEGGCRIYADRPIECRLFPYTVSHIAKGRKKIVMEFHDATDCPQKGRLLMPEEEARDLILALGRSAFGRNKPIVIVRRRERTGLRRCLNLLDPLLDGISRLVRACR